MHRLGRILALCSLLWQTHAWKGRDGSAPLRVAVVGSGISGSSSAAAIREQLARLHAHSNSPSHDGDAQSIGRLSHATIDVYEASDRIGGRLYARSMAGVDVVEIGGSIIHNSNQFMANFTREAGLTAVKPSFTESESSSSMAIFNGRKFVFSTHPSSLVTLGKTIWRYGLSPMQMRSHVRTAVSNFERIYSHLAQGRAFHSVEDFLDIVKGRDLVAETLKKRFKDIGIWDRVTDELVASITRVNYGQNVSINAFAGSIALAGSSDDLWAVKEGNWKVCEYLLDKADAELHLNSTVTQVEQLSSGQYVLHVSRSGSKPSRSHPYDFVVWANHLSSSKATFDAKIDVCDDWKGHHTHASFVVGRPNPAAFGLKHSDHALLPVFLLTTETSEVPFSSLSMVRPLAVYDDHGKKHTIQGYGLYKVFSRSPLTDASLRSLFDLGKVASVDRQGQPTARLPPHVLHHEDWMAYPLLSPRSTFPKLRLARGLYYPNAIESTASAMEILAISGANVGLMVADDIAAAQSPTSSAAAGDEAGQAASKDRSQRSVGDL